MNTFDSIYSIKGETKYIDVLQQVQEYMTALGGFNKENLSGDDVFRYKKTIENYIMKSQLKCAECTTLSELIDRLYNSMTQYDVLTPYLQQETYKRMGIEEIYGRWNCIYLLTKKGKIRLKEKFPSPISALHILNRMCDKFNAQVNEGTPKALGEFRPNIRISIVGSPITSPELGPEFNIRIVHGSEMTRKLLLESGTVSEDGLKFLELCVSKKINIAIAGATGSGKTGTMYYLLSHISQTAEKRVGTVEIECREFDLIRYDEDGEVINDVFHWVTRSSDSERYNINANDLIEIILRFKPDVVGVGEMRNAEALIACELGITGHGIITTTHADSAPTGYDRIVMLGKKANMGYDDNTLYKLALKAFPIMVYQKQCDDANKSRKLYEIVEGVAYRDETVIVNPLFRYVVSDNKEDSKLSIGTFKQVGTISDKLRQRFIDNGASQATLKMF